MSSALDDDDFASFIAAQPHVSAVSSHHLRYPLPVIRRTILFDCCFLRHPLDRLQSIYTYLRAEPELGAQDPTLVLSQSVSPREFMARLIDESPHFVGNAQTLLIASEGAFTRPLDAADLAVAFETLRRMAFPGLLDLFDESMVAAEHFWGPAFPRLRIHYAPQNVTRPAHGSLAQRLDELRTLWGADVYDELMRLNRLDLELCAFAGGEIHRRFALVPNAEERLKEFRNRCGRVRFQEAS